MKGHKTESKKSVAFKANIDSHDVDADQDECEDLIDSFALLTRKKFGGSSKKENFRKTYKSDGTPSSDVKERSNKWEKSKKKGQQCFKCEWYGHFQADCANLKGSENQKRANLDTHTDEDTEESENEEVIHIGHRQWSWSQSL